MSINADRKLKILQKTFKLQFANEKTMTIKNHAKQKSSMEIEL